MPALRWLTGGGFVLAEDDTDMLEMQIKGGMLRGGWDCGGGLFLFIICETAVSHEMAEGIPVRETKRFALF